MQPLADLLRPTTLADYIGQLHLVGEGAPLRRIIETGNLPSLIFWGPPGCGKTTLAKILASSVGADFHYLSAVSAKKEDIKNLVDHVQPGQKTVLFLDEIHRFNKAQQDYLLPYVESGTLILIGATTENPSFEVISPLLSRCHVYVLKPLEDSALTQLLDRVLSHLSAELSPDGLDFLLTYANGDGRKAISVLESSHNLYGKKLSKQMLLDTLQSPYLRYDSAGEEHYNTISAFIKSLRASQVDAALYYLARMVAAGEDPLFIARRMVIFASEDIGLAVPTALVVANAVFRAVETIGYPECQLNLAEGAAYLATCHKSRSVNDAFFAALDDVKTHGNLEIPFKVRNAPTKLMKNLGYGKGYDMRDPESFLPAKLKNKKYYNPKPHD